MTDHSIQRALRMIDESVLSTMFDDDFQRLTLAVLKDYARRNEVAPQYWTLSPRGQPPTGASSRGPAIQRFEGWQDASPTEISLGLASAHRITDGKDVFHLLVLKKTPATTITMRDILVNEDWPNPLMRLETPRDREDGR